MINNFIENEIKLKSTDTYCGIIGESPSKGARSPVLWNACFEIFDFSSYFYPFDVLGAGLKELVEYLKNDKSFLGGAVAVPHKEDILPLLDCVEEEAKLIGAVNLIYRKNGMLWGANTDGIGAVASVSEYLNEAIDLFAKGKNITLIGTGGAAKACAVYFAKCAGENGHITIIGRDSKKTESLAEKCSIYSNVRVGNFNDIEKELPDTDFLVNSTVIGYENHIRIGKKYFYYEPFSPLELVTDDGFLENNLEFRVSWLSENIENIQSNFSNSLTKLAKLKKSAVVMDVIYQPEKTQLLNMSKMLGYNTISGKRMNLLQAAFGFQKAFQGQNVSIDKISQIMGKI